MAFLSLDQIAEIQEIARRYQEGEGKQSPANGATHQATKEPPEAAAAVTTLEEHIADVARRREQVGIPDDEAARDAMRNKGHGRTESKKVLLLACAARARAAGLEPLPTYIDGERI